MKKRSIVCPWIDYMKAVDIIPYTWIIDNLELAGINNQISRVTKSSMKTWKVELTYGQEILDKVPIH